MIKLVAIIVLVVFAFVMIRKNKRLYRGVRERRGKILDRMAEPPKKHE